MQITGTVTHVEVEGGFWGIMGDDGVPYHPIEGFPSGFEKEGLRIRAKAKDFDGMTMFMWGRPVVVQSIEELNTGAK